MITATFPNGREVRAIILDEPYQGVNGLVECVKCEWRTVITSSDTDGITEEIEQFAKTHQCEAE